MWFRGPGVQLRPSRSGLAAAVPGASGPQLQLEVSINGVSPKWMVYNGASIQL